MLIPTPAEIARLPLAEQRRVLRLLKKHEEATRIDKARSGYMDYVRYMWPGFIEGAHHRKMAEIFDRVLFGDLRRVIINLGPRHTKSEFASKFLPSMKLGLDPTAKIIQATHTGDYSVAWGRKTRDVVKSKKYQKLFPGTKLNKDATAAGYWMTEDEGEYYAVGVGGGIAGRGADLFIVDDPHTEQDFIQAVLSGSSDVFDKVYEWYQTGPRQRLQPGAAIVVVMTRWHLRDLTGRLIKKMISGGKDKWEIFELPALLPSGTQLWPEYWPLEELLATKESLSVAQWNAQFMQNPTAEEGAILKREWWKIWPHTKAPECHFVIQTWDTAYKKNQRNDRSASTTWGVFDWPDENNELRPNIILLDAFAERIEFPELKRKALQFYKERTPDACIIEAKASGTSLIQELRAIGVPVSDYTPVRGTKASPNDKINRANGVSAILESGRVWRPDTRWAEEVQEECAAFPAGDHDDYVDNCIMAWSRFRSGGYLPLPDDYDDDEDYYREPADYY